MDITKPFAAAIAAQLDHQLTIEEIGALLEKPKFEAQGDLAFPCFTLAKKFRKSPAAVAADIASGIQDSSLAKVVADGPYVNGFLNRSTVSQHVLTTILETGASYGSSSAGADRSITLDLSSPNIAKPFSMGHLRSTVIGNALANIAEKHGYQTVRINHLGDWGTQFGKLIAAYKKWGKDEQIEANPIKELLKLYVKFHEEAKTDPALEIEGRLWFKRLEDGDGEAQRLWTWFREESLQEFNKIYELLDVRFDSVHGEAFYNDKMDEVVELLKEKKLLQESEGAEVVDLSDHDLPPLLIRKSDGATLYGTRDAAAALYRQRQYHFAESLYVVGQEQSLHFKQLFLTLQKMGYEWAQHMHHIPFGFILKNGKKMSTRKGEIVLLEEVIREAIELAGQNIREKNPSLPNPAEVAHQVGVGAIIFHDLKNDRQSNIEFSLEHMLRFEGATGPYVQYTHARACSILRKAEIYNAQLTPNGLDDDASWPVIKLLLAFPEVINRSFKEYEPSVIAKFVLELAQAFNAFYGKVKVLSEDREQETRLALVQAVVIVLNEGLRLLGVKAPMEM
ncbi:arginine--tRNA ligase [Planococcus lenghuensis]|uniref:Arginine--tRNA ligase n=1 Tax=Planococcus lenghuensis TaxID=2213202 RepID=A0A1Q2L3S6_9BACL|nr:arginine--tRNA ligase [Planococcus lenghuensis]AQQ55073.1 arginine--tRNA ligase [Planococcus lenghuensis]